MRSWQDWYDNLLPEDFVLEPIRNRCNTDPLDDFLAEFNNEEEYFEKTRLKKEEVAASSTIQTL